MKTIYITLLMLCASLTLFAAPRTTEPGGDPNNVKPKTDAVVTGHVVDAKTGEHLPYINIIVKGTTIGVATDATGHYMLKDLPAGELTIEASFIGYKKAVRKVKTKPNTMLEINFE